MIVKSNSGAIERLSCQRVAVVPDVDVAVVPVIAVADESVVDIVPVRPVAEVSDGMVVLPGAAVSVVVIDVSVAAVSVFVFSSFRQPAAKMPTRTAASNARTNDFFIKCGGNIGTSAAMSSSPPVPLRRLDTPVTCTVPSFDGTVIHYDLYDTPSRAAMLVVPGFWRDRRHEAMVRMAALLTSSGYRTAVIDVRGHGESEGTYGFNHHEHHDVAAVAKDLLRRTPVEAITLVGFSYGGAIAISTAARHELPIASLMLISPVADFGMIVPRINPFTIHRHIAFSQALKRPRFAWRMRRSAKLRALDDVADVRVPTCFIHVKNDWLVAHRHSIDLYERANEPKELHILDLAGNYHADRIFSVASESIEPIVRSFLERFTPR